MTDPHEELLQQLNEMQAARGIDADTRKVIGVLTDTIHTLSEEIDDLQERVTELEERAESDERSEDGEQKQAWYSER